MSDPNELEASPSKKPGPLWLGLTPEEREARVLKASSEYMDPPPVTPPRSRMTSKNRGRKQLPPGGWPGPDRFPTTPSQSKTTSRNLGKRRLPPAETDDNLPQTSDTGEMDSRPPKQPRLTTEQKRAKDLAIPPPSNFTDKLLWNVAPAQDSEHLGYALELLAVVDPLITQRKWSLDMQRYLRDTMPYYTHTVSSRKSMSNHHYYKNFLKDSNPINVMGLKVIFGPNKVGKSKTIEQEALRSFPNWRFVDEPSPSHNIPQWVTEGKRLGEIERDLEKVSSHVKAQNGLLAGVKQTVKESIKLQNAGFQHLVTKSTAESLASKQSDNISDGFKRCHSKMDEMMDVLRDPNQPTTIGPASLAIGQAPVVTNREYTPPDPELMELLRKMDARNKRMETRQKKFHAEVRTRLTELEKVTKKHSRDSREDHDYILSGLADVQKKVPNSTYEEEVPDSSTEADSTSDEEDPRQ